MRVKSLLPHISQLFIDEAAQASEPACLIPVCGLLTPGGTLVLAGDPQQLGPVVISSLANKQGFGQYPTEHYYQALNILMHKGTLETIKCCCHHHQPVSIH